MNKKPQLWNLVSLFTQVGGKSFGGQVPVHLWDSLVSRGWLTQKDYLEAVNWSQCVPGCNGTNLSAYLGWQFKGAWGALLATLALLLPGVVMLLLATIIITKIPQQHHIIQGILSSVGAATVGLLLGMTWKITRSALQHPVKLLIATATFICIGLLRLPVFLVIVFLGLMSWYLGEQFIKRDNGKPV